MNYKFSKKKFEIIKNVLKNLDDGENLDIDSRRQVNSSDKEIIWEESAGDYRFDPEDFKKDIIGHVCIKGWLQLHEC